MSHTGATSTPPTPPTPPTSAARGRRVTQGARHPRLVRPQERRVVAGVAAGLGWRLGVDPVLVRIAFALLTFAGGAGLVLYGILWATIPPAAETPPRRRPATGQQAVALALIVLGVLLLLRAFGVWFGDQVVGPMVLLAAGSAVLWTRADTDDRANWSHLANSAPGDALRRAAAAPTSPLRIVAGTALVALAIAGALATTGSFTGAQELIIVLLTALAGLGLLFGPWLWRLIDQLGEERRERIRQEERAELAAHLHDSVLQTLALIQRGSDDPKRMVALARRQERELRTWLYGATAPGTAMSLTEAVRGITEEVEAIHGLTIETVVVGETALDEHVWALLAAIREACVNVAKHSGTDRADVFVEVEDDQVVAFIRDRGRGFDPEAVPDDRAGIRGSIVERVERHGGRATLHTAPDAGTEVEVTVPRPPGRSDEVPEPSPVTPGHATPGHASTAGHATPGHASTAGDAAPPRRATDPVGSATPPRPAAPGGHQP